MSDFIARYLDEVRAIAGGLDRASIERLLDLLVDVRERSGRLFILGVGGSAANASHAVNDFRKIARIEAYAPTDNVSELTARINDEGWEDSFVAWLRGCRLASRDAVLVFSVGGGDAERGVSANIVRALQYAQEVGVPIGGIVGRDGGYTARVATAAVLVPTAHPETVTPHSESFQAVIWHLLVSHPRLRRAETRWESIKP